MLGFGLLLSKQISEKYGGKLEFVSEYNVGSTFAFSFEIELRDATEIERRPSAIRTSPEEELKEEKSPKFGNGGSARHNVEDSHVEIGQGEQRKPKLEQLLTNN